MPDFRRQLDVPYREQEEATYCGPACAQMVLLSLPDPRGEIGGITQDELETFIGRDENQSIDEGVEWGLGTAPDQLCTVLTERKPSTFPRSFNIEHPTSADEISRTIVRAIFDDGAPAVALVWGMGHWIVVKGFVTNKRPTAANDDYQIKAFIVNDPNVPGDHHITYRTWLGNNRRNRRDGRMTGVPRGIPPNSDNPSMWAGDFVAVCDPPMQDKMSEAEDDSLEPLVDDNEDAEPSTRSSQPAARSQDKLGQAEVTEYALDGLQQITQDETFERRDLLKEVQPAEPVLVQRLDLENSYYYVVPMVTGDDNFPVAVTVDAYSGALQEALFAFPDDQNAIPKIDPTARHLIGKSIKLPDGKQVILAEEYYYPTLVWKPCFQSFSPFFPFYLFTVGGQQIYLRIDDRVTDTREVENKRRFILETSVQDAHSPLSRAERRANANKPLTKNKVITKLEELLPGL